MLAPFGPAPDDPEIARYLSVAAGEHVLLLPSEPSEWSLAQKSSGGATMVPQVKGLSYVMDPTLAHLL